VLFLTTTFLYSTVLFSAHRFLFHTVTFFYLWLALLNIKRLNMSEAPLLAVIATLAACHFGVAAAFHGTSEILQSLSLAAFVCSSLVLAPRFEEIRAVFSKFLFYVIIPGALVSILIGSSLAGTGDGTPPSLFPLPSTNFRVSLAPWGGTLHFTMEVGILALLFVSSDRSLNSLKRTAALAGSCYLLIFCGARTGVLAAIFIFGCSWLWEKRFRVRNSLVFILLTIVLAVGFGIDGVKSGFGIDNAIGRFFRIDSLSNDKTSGRGWLWDYHFFKFTEHPFTGAGRAVLDFESGANVEIGESAKASMESFYTHQLAVYGIAGAAPLIMHVFIFLTSLRRSKRVACLFSGTCIILTAFNSTYATPYGTFSGIMYFSLGALLRSERSPPSCKQGGRALERQAT